MSTLEFPIPLQEVLNAADRLEAALLSTPKPDLITAPASPEDLRRALTIAIDWFESVEEHYGHPSRGDRGRPPQLTEPWYHPKSVLAFFLDRWRPGHAPEFANLNAFLGPLPLELSDSRADALRVSIFGNETGFRDQLARRAFLNEDWPEYRDRISLFMTSTESRARRLIQWVRDGARDYQLARAPLIRLLREDKRNRVVITVEMAGLRREVAITNAMLEVLKEWRAGKTASTNRRVWGRLQQLLPELTEFVTKAHPLSRSDGNTVALNVDPMLTERIDVGSPE